MKFIKKKIYARSGIVKEFDDCLIMGILNITPDSFSDGGKYQSLNDIKAHFKHLLNSGADIIDIGAESTRPSATKIDAETEIKRLENVLKVLRKEFPDTLISLDTYKPEVAEYFLDLNEVDFINDVGTYIDESGKFPMAEIAAKFNCSLVITHNSRKDKTFTEEKLLADFEYIINTAKAMKLCEDKLILDAGFGFGKTFSQNYNILRNLEIMKSLDLPILVGVSRKSFIKEVLGSDDVNKLDQATAIISSYLIRDNVCDILRVHDVEKTLIAKKIAEKFTK